MATTIAVVVSPHQSSFLLRRAREKRMAPLDLKEVLVKFDALAFVLPTFSLGFWKSFSFSFFFLLLDPIVCRLLVIEVFRVEVVKNSAG